MDPTALAAAAVAFLAPYLIKAGESLAEKMGETLPENAAKLWKAIADKFKEEAAAEVAARDVAADPADEDNLAAFRKELKKALRNDAGFAAEIERLLKQAQGLAMTMIAASEGGAVVMGDGAAIGVKGDVQGSIVIGNNNLTADKVQQGGLNNEGSITIGSGDLVANDKNTAGGDIVKGDDDTQ
jgi:hypothetical protein